MEFFPDMLFVAVVTWLVLWLLCMACLQTYYREREKFWDRIVAKLKGDKNDK